MLGISPSKMLLLRMKGALLPGRLSNAEKLLLLLHRGKKGLGSLLAKAPPPGVLKRKYWDLFAQSAPARLQYLAKKVKERPLLGG